MKYPDSPRRNPSRARVALLPLTMLLAGAALGYVLGSSGFRWSSEDTAPAEAANASAITFQGKAGKDAPGGDAISALLDSNGLDTERSRRVLAYVDSVKDGDLESQIDEILARRRGRQGYDLIRSLYRKWVGRDPAAALRHAGELVGRSREHALRAVLISWAAKDPHAVLAWSEEHGKASETQSGVHTALRTIARENPEEAIALAEQGRLPGRDASFLYAIWAERDPGAAAARALSIPRANERGNALRSIAMQWTYEDPQAAWEWGNGLEHARDRDAALHSVVNTVARDGDTDRAIAFLDEMTPGQTRHNATRQRTSSQ